MGNNLTSVGALAYQGTNAPSPSNVTVHYNAPTSNYYQGFAIGDFWVHRVSQTSNANELWVLMGVAGNVANWVQLTGNMGPLLSLTGDTGGAVFPLAGNINVVGDGVHIAVAGNPGTHTLTISAMGTGTVETLQGNTGSPVGPLAGNIFVEGDGTTISVSGSPGTHTLTISAVGTGLVETLTAQSGGPVSPLAGNINVVGDGLTVAIVGNPGTHTLTASTTGALAVQYVTDAGTAVPSAAILNVLGGTSARDINTKGSGNTIHVDLNNTITLGDLSTITPGNPSLTLTSGDLQLNGGTASGSTNPKIVFGPSNNYISFYKNNIFMGAATGNTTMNTSFNVGIGAGVLALATSGDQNCAYGNAVLRSCTSGANNCLIGYVAGSEITTGSNNVGIGTTVFADGVAGLTTGANNIGIGTNTGQNYTSSESSNILLNNTGTVGESNVLRIGAGTGSSTQQLAKSFIGGIRGITTDAADAIAVLISSTGQLGTVSSSIRYKENVQDMANSSTPLMKLRPVTFNYKKQGNTTTPDGLRSTSKDYGLIAEEVAEIFPDLVVYNDKGEAESVKYHIICSILLNEVQKLSKRIEALEKITPTKEDL